MIRNGEIGLADVKRIFRHYWWILVVSTVLCGAVGLILTHFLPKKYTSTTAVLVELPMVPTDVVKPVVTDDLNHRLGSMKELIFSRSRLQPIIEKLNLYPQERETAHMEDLVEELRKSIDVALIRPMPGSLNPQPPGFQVSVTLDNPQLAQQICTEITSMFLEQNAKRREQQSVGTTQFLSQQLDEAKARLDEQDAKLAKFQIEHLGSLPEEEQSNLSRLSGMYSQLDAATQAISRLQQEKEMTETILNSQEANWKAKLTQERNPETQEQQLATLQDELAALLARYTPEHPDIIRVKSQIEDLKRKMAEEPGEKKLTKAEQVYLREPPQLQQLRIKIKQDESNIAELTKRQSQIQEQMRAVEARVQTTPLVHQQLKDLTRNYQTALEMYNELLKKKQSSEIATDLEHQQEGETFKVLDAPSLPLTPSFPKILNFVGGGLGAGLVLAIGIMYLLGASDKSMYTERDVETCLKMPVLTMVPAFDVSGTGRHQHTLR